MSIEDALTQETVPHYTELRPTLCGSFNLSARAAIPFFQSIMTIEEAAKELDLVENLPSDLRSKWRLEELFQREIDWERVEKDIVDNYLKRPEKLTFFNSITVALLPIDSSRMLSSGYADLPKVPEIPERLRTPQWKVINVGGVQIVKSESTNHGNIRWNPRTIFAATIDGQHRLAALRVLVQNGNLNRAQLDTKISVLFLVLDPKAGLLVDQTNLGSNENQILAIVREVFIDLNHHSKEVARARRILLDDQEIESRCLRQLLCQRIGEDSQERLPLGLVHWQHSVSAKFNAGDNTGPFITTIELLYWIIVDVLSLKRPNDPMDRDLVLKFVDTIESALAIREYITSHQANFQGIAPLASYVEKHHLRDGLETPFVNPNAPYLRACEESFSEKWRPIIVGVLLHFSPYANFIIEVNKRGGITGDLAFFLVQPKRAQDAQSKAWGEALEEKIERPLKELASMKTKNWAFYAVFQKAIFRAARLAWQNYEVVPGGSIGATAFAQKWVLFLNWLDAKGTFELAATTAPGSKDKLWLGIGLNQSQTVRYNNAAVSRLCSLLMSWWYLHHSRLSRVGLFIQKAEKNDVNEKFPDLKPFLDDIRKGLRTVVGSGEIEPDEKEISRKIEERLKAILEIAKNPETSDLETDPQQESVTT